MANLDKKDGEDEEMLAHLDLLMNMDMLEDEQTFSLVKDQEFMSAQDASEGNSNEKDRKE